MTTSIEREILIAAPVDIVWRVVTDPEQITQWFSDVADVELTTGYQGALTFHQPGTDAPTVAYITVQAFEPHRCFRYRWSYEPGTIPAVGNSVLVEFVLTAVDGGTQLRVVESGVDALAWSQEQKDAYVVEHLAGWNHHLGRLETYLAKLPA